MSGPGIHVFEDRFSFLSFSDEIVGHEHIDRRLPMIMGENGWVQARVKIIVRVRNCEYSGMFCLILYVLWSMCSESVIIWKWPAGWKWYELVRLWTNAIISVQNVCVLKQCKDDCNCGWAECVHDWAVFVWPGIHVFLARFFCFSFSDERVGHKHMDPRQPVIMSEDVWVRAIVEVMCQCVK